MRISKIKIRNLYGIKEYTTDDPELIVTEL